MAVVRQTAGQRGKRLALALSPMGCSPSIFGAHLKDRQGAVGKDETVSGRVWHEKKPKERPRRSREDWL